MGGWTAGILSVGISAEGWEGLVSDGWIDGLQEEVNKPDIFLKKYLNGVIVL